VSLNQEDAGAGQRYRDLIYANVSDSTCELHGYPGVSFRNDGGTQFGAAATYIKGTPTTVILKSGASAHDTVHYSNGGFYDCTQVQATRLRVYPPGSTSWLTIPFDEVVCKESTQKLLQVGVITPGAGPTVGADSPS